MSSIIVLDSSDEDESPPKKVTVKSLTDTSNISANTNASAAKNQNAKPRAIPSGITVTPRLSPTSVGTKISSNMQSLSSSSFSTSFQALNSIINHERQTPTPPNRQTPSSINQRKRKTPTPPKTMPRLTAKCFGTMSNSSPAKAATTLAPLPPIMPMITGVHSMAAAGATPPLQLMATPHNLGAFMGLNDQLMINPHLVPSSLPPNTTITAHANPNQNNINNNFKIHLPFNKPTNTTPSPTASPALTAPKTPSPQPGRADRSSKRIMPTTLLKSSDEGWQRHKQTTQNEKHLQRTPVSLNNDVIIEKLPPSTESPRSISACSSTHHTPMTSPTTPKSQKSPDVIMLSTYSDHTPVLRKETETILDLTHSPDKVSTGMAGEIVDLVNTHNKSVKHINGEAKKVTPEQKPEKPPPKPPLEPEYEELIKTCRSADPSKDMEKLIKSKLIKYYYEVHSDYVKSKSFRKSIQRVMESIKAKPDLVYYNLKTIVEELKVRRKARLVEETATTTSETVETSNGKSPDSETNTSESTAKNTNTTNVSKVPDTPALATELSATSTTSTGNKKLDEQIKKLNKALYVLTKRIEVLEQTEVDWDDDDSSFLQVERYKKRACQIYEKICDLTGESKNAHRLVKRPIKFNETRIPQFNKTLQAFINRTKEFPDYYDVLRMLEHCNRTYSLGLVNFEIKNIAEDAFIKVGKLLQSRRKADLYETVTHFAGDGKDPAKTDPMLAAKLNDNLKNHKKITDILEKYARKQDMPEEDEEEKAEKSEISCPEGSVEKEEKLKDECTVTALLNDKTMTTEVVTKTERIENVTQPAVKKVKIDADEDEYEDEDEEDDDEDDLEENLDEQVETLANGGDISDNESESEMTSKDKKNGFINLLSPNTSSECFNNSSPGVEKGLDSTNTINDMSVLTEEMELANNTQTILMAIDTSTNVIDVELSSHKMNSESDNLVMNNNNNKADTTSITITKTVLNANEFPSPPSPPTPLSSIIPTRNGKLKDTPPHPFINHDNTATATIYSIANPSIKNNATVGTTTTTADLKIVHVSSLEPDISDNAVANNKDGRNISPANKSQEEIVISDEES